MKCLFWDDRLDFFRILAEKLGEEFSFMSGDSEVLTDPDELAACDVIIAGVPLQPSPRLRESAATLERLVVNSAGVPVVAFLAAPDRTAMRQVIATGAYDYFVESESMEELRIILRRAARFHELSEELHNLKRAAEREPVYGAIAGTNPKMVEILNFARKIASTDANVLITGETGTGKELLARAIHQDSLRARQPFVAVACSSLPETLIEAELFGHEKGAFTGAVTMRRGRFEAAGRGTIFLDEIGELSPSLQIKLLRVLQERVFERLGSNQQHCMEARVICATNRDLKVLTRAGDFRPDLYYRLNTIEIRVPPLRERRDDIVVLAHAFLQKYTQSPPRPAVRISAPALCALKRYPWPGNVRELEHAMERAAVVCEAADIRLQDLPGEIVEWDGPADDDASSLEMEVRAFKRHLIQEILKQSGNNKVQAARTLGISRSSLHRLIDELGIHQLRVLGERSGMVKSA